VHHQSEDYNFAVARRRRALVWTIWPAGPALIASPGDFLIVDSFSTLYQF